jgi:diguanylate cyclase (GGDEF)-like protein
MNPAVFAAFAGFFVALSLAGAISAQLNRSRASAAYAVLAAVAAANACDGLFQSAFVLSATLVSLYAVAIAAFALALLRTPRYDRTVSWILAGVVLINLPLVFVGGVPHEVAFDALLAMLVVVGARALPYEGPIAILYLIALAGPVFNAIVTAPPAFLGGIAWEAAFFAYAVALRSRGIQMERDRFERLAYLDPLTGVSNRRTFDETLVRMWNVARRAKVPIAVAMVDIDHFKRLNDTRGHQVGDECLRRVAALCSSALRRAGDCFARYGGEEFAAILVNIDHDHAVTLAEHMRKVVERDGGITISVGIASRVPAPSDDPLALIADADDALYRAKHEGRNRVRVAVPPTASPLTVT